jgi:hypothetical protein
MKIKLKESINDELIAVGCKPGDEIKVEAISGKTGAVYFTKYRNDVNQQCVVYPEDYEVIEPLK